MRLLLLVTIGRACLGGCTGEDNWSRDYTVCTMLCPVGGNMFKS